MSSTPDWKLIKNEYEIMHTGVKELAQGHHTSESMINAAVKSEQWSRKSIDQMSPDDISERLVMMDAFHQNSLVPKFIMLQAKMLDKCDSLLDLVMAIDDAPNLRIVSEVIEKHRPNVLGVKKEGQNDNNIQIRILNRVGDSDSGEKVSTSAVEITQSAGKTNGLGALTKLT